MNLSPQNAFGELLLDLIEAQYGDIDQGVIALIQTTGLDESEVVALINGDIVVDSQALLSGILTAFPDADNDDVMLFLDVATGVEESDRATLEAAIGDYQEQEAAQNDYYNQYESAEPAAAESGDGNSGFGRNTMNANFANQLASQQAQINELVNGISNFNHYQALEARLNDVDTLATRYVDSGVLPPSYKSILVGNFSNPKERVAQFSDIAAKNGVNPETMLFATEYALGMLAEASQFVEFSDYSLSEEDVQLANFSASMDYIAAADAAAIFNS